MSLIETLLSILLATIVITISVKAITLPTVKKSPQIQLRSDSYAVEKISALLETVMEEVDLHRLNALPKIDSTNKISSISLATQLTLKLSQPATIITDSTSPFTTTACPLFDGGALNSHGYLGVSPDGVVPLKEVAKPSGGRCKTFSLAVTESLVVAPPLFPKLSITRLIPISREYSLTTDNSYELRYQGYRDGRIIENQPILKGVKNIVYNIRSNTSSAHELIATITLENDKQYIKLYPQHLKRTSFINLLHETYR